jgi:hypothetical protein
MLQRSPSKEQTMRYVLCMGFLDVLRGLFRKKQDDDDMPYSIVMLLRSPFAMSEEVLEAAASKAYGVPYDGSHEMYFVTRNPLLTMVKAGASLINVLEAAEPYLGNPAEVAQGFKNKRLGSAWTEHHTWVAFDLMNRDVAKKQAYWVLAALVAELLDTRCAGIYLPKENQFTIQSDGSTVAHLRRLGDQSPRHIEDAMSRSSPD